MADFNLGGILDALTSNTTARIGNTQQAVSQQAYDTSQLESLLTGNVEAARGIIAEKTKLAAEKAAIETQNAQVQERAQAIVGLNPDDLNNDFVKSVARYNQAEEQRRTSQRQLSEAASVGLLDNPVEWLFNQLAIPGMERQVAGATAERDGAAKDIQTRTAMLTQHKSAVTANIADTARQYNLDLARVSAQEAFVKLREEEAKNLSAVSSRKLNEASLRDKVFNLKDEQINKVLTIEDLQMRRQQSAMAFANAVEERKIRVEKAAEEDAAKQQANLNLQRYSQFTGGPAYTVDMLKMMPKAQAEHLWTVATTGSLGANMQEVLLALQKDPTALGTIQANNPVVAQTISKLTDGLSSYMTTIASKAGPDGKKPTEKQALVQAFDTYEDELAKSMSLPGFAKPLNSPAWDKQFNPYRADHKLMLHIVEQGNAKFLNENLVTKAAQALQSTVPGVSEGFTGENESTILKSIAARVAARELPAKKAAQDIVQYYSAATQIGADQTQYGIFKLPLQKRYMVAFPDKDVHDRAIQADLLNPASVENMLSNLARPKKFGASLGYPALDTIFEVGAKATPFGVGFSAVTDAKNLELVGRAQTLIKGPVADALRGYKLEDAR